MNIRPWKNNVWPPQLPTDTLTAPVRPPLWISHPQSTLKKPTPLPTLSGPVRDTPPYRAIPFRDSIAEGGIAPILPGFHRVSRQYR